MRALPAALLALGAVLAAPGARADEVPTAAGQPVTLEAGPLRVTAATPAWNTGGDAKTFRNAGTTPEGVDWNLLELIPAQESFEAWTRIWAILAERGNTRPLEGYKADILLAYLPECGEVATRGRVVAKAETHEVFLIPCPQMKSDPAQGQITVMLIASTGADWVRLYEEIKVPPYPDGGDLPQEAVDALNIFLRTLSEFRLGTSAPAEGQ